MKIFAKRVLQPGGAAIIFFIVNTRNLEETKNSYLQNGAFEKNFDHRT